MKFLKSSCIISNFFFNFLSNISFLIQQYLIVPETYIALQSIYVEKLWNCSCYVLLFKSLTFMRWHWFLWFKNQKVLHKCLLILQDIPHSAADSTLYNISCPCKDKIIHFLYIIWIYSNLLLASRIDCSILTFLKNSPSISPESFVIFPN